MIGEKARGRTNRKRLNRALLKMTTINQALHDHRRSLLEQERHTASLEVRHNTGQPAETEIVNGQLEAHADAFTTDEDFVVERHPYSGWVCYHKDHDWAPDAVNAFYRGHGDTEAEAIEDYRELNDLDSKLQWFADYQNPNSDPQDLQERAKDLGIDGRDWQAYHERREAALDEAARQF